MSKWETVIGLEVHAELSTKSKIFCSCPAHFGGEPNTHVCPVCSGMPGTLPVLNKEVVEYAIKLGTVLNCNITRNNKFDRKNYFYPDLPKAYQVSQLYAPICQNGYVEIEVDGKTKSITISEIHMEEDAGKLIHDTSGNTYTDYNRCGVPLLEIVTGADFSNEQEVVAYLEKLKETLLYLDICDCKMQEGSLRADVNLSIRPIGGELGTRTEMKNLNSFKAIARAIEAERERQIDLLEAGEKITQETRRWDDDRGVSYAMRSKENAQDYRYFPEPDLLPIYIDDSWLNSVKNSLPELAQEKRNRYENDFKLTNKESVILTSHKNISDLFENLTKETNEPKECANLVTGEIMRLLKSTNTIADDLNVDHKKLSYVTSLVLAKKINRDVAKAVIEEVFVNNIDPENYIKEKNLIIVEDTGAVESIVSEIIASNPKVVDDFKAGKEKAIGFFMGQSMKKLQGRGNPDTVKAVIIDQLSKL